MRGRLAAVLFGLLVAGVLAYSVGTPSARAFQPNGVFRPPTAEERAVAKEVWRLTREGGTQAQKDAARAVVRRSLYTAVPRLAPYVLSRGGLLGAAAGTWTIVGLELYFLPCWECEGESIPFGVEMAPAPGSMSGQAFDQYQTALGQTQVFVTYISARRDAGRTKISVYSARNVVKFYRYQRSNGTEIVRGSFPNLQLNPQPPFGTQSPLSVVNDGPIPQPVPKFDKAVSMSYDASYGGEALLRLNHQDSSSSATVYRERVLCQPNGGPCVGNEALPTYDVGAMSDGKPTGGGDFRTTSEEGNQFINEVVTDPQTEETITPEKWEELWGEDAPPEWPEPDPYQSPTADPDKDGKPNETDDDPEGDGDPDGDGDPNEHPQIAPYPTNPDIDHDGEPDQSDPDDDNDGVPDEVDGNPHVPDAPDADQDGEPDSTDQDDDNDGIPDKSDPDPTTPTDPGSLPDDHPYADPDEDGEPNHSDPDDDGDEIPDEEDEKPYVPGPWPDYHPFADPDEDGEPNRRDRDDDEDSVPDWQEPEPWNPASPSDPELDEDEDGLPNWDDPWPGNPYAPYDPTKDGDGDDVPDYKDPEIGDPNVPYSPNGPSTDTPTWNEPPGAPSRPWGPDAPWRPGNPGDPNVPTQPSNPNMPTTQNTPQNPTDPSVPGQSYPTNPQQPDDPTTEQNPDDPATDCKCPEPIKPKWDVPGINIGSVFPFSLVVWAIDALGELNEEPRLPVWELPVLGEVDLNQFGMIFAGVKGVITFFIVVGMVLIWYWYIKGSEA